MTFPDVANIDEVSESTWPAASQHRVGPFLLREGQGGGQRVSAATAENAFTAHDIATAEHAMIDMGQGPIFRVRSGEAELDGLLDDAGYVVHDPVNILVTNTGPVAALELPQVKSFPIWPPLAIMDELWSDGGIGSERRAVMDRVGGPKVAILGRGDAQPAGVAFAAAHNGVAMLHAVHVSSSLRRRKVAQYMTIAIARWAQDVGARHLATLCVRENAAANTMFGMLGFQVVGSYHYRVPKSAKG